MPLTLKKLPHKTLAHFRLNFEDVRFRVGAHLPKLSTTQLLVRDWKRATNKALLKSFTKRLTLLKKKWQKRRKHGFTITIKITPLKIALIILLGVVVWPNTSHTVAEPLPTPPPPKVIKKLHVKAPKKLSEVHIATEVSSAASTAPIAAFNPTGNKQSWLSQSGIPASLWWAVDYIVSRESGWDPCAYNPGQHDCSAYPSTACGLVQQNPCHKIPGDWRDPVAALKWQFNYVNSVYGGYPQAVEHWKAFSSY